ncbi:hypothetical protein [Noviherbaspirillum malthae]|uniref:hypothetical protein n=1 Tax=Noviherbaspirillum malthae TaxID=1260987 RepID=UPI00188EBD06|nr:hypothetical protein [Noviherbaspirillum malthae]
MIIDRKTGSHEPATMQMTVPIGTPVQRIAQTFIAQVSGELTRVELALQSCSAIPVALHIEVRRGSALDSPIIATGVVDPAALPTATSGRCTIDAPVYWANVPLSPASVNVRAGETLSVWPFSNEPVSYAWAGSAVSATSVSDMSYANSSASAGSAVSPAGQTTVWSTDTKATGKQAIAGFAPGFRTFVVPTAN